MGIISGLYLNISIAFFIVLLIILCIKNRTFNRYLKVFINKKIILIVFVSASIFFSYTLIEEMLYQKVYNIPNKITLEGKIISKMTESEYGNKYIFLAQNKRFILLTAENLEYGDFIKINAEYIAPEESRNYKGFNYSRYLKSQKIYGTLKSEIIEVLNKNTCNSVFTLSNKLQTKIIENSKRVIPKDTGELFIGILLGEKDNIEEDIIKSFKTSSLSHILAVSGMHVSYIILGITYIASKVKIHKKIAYISTILVLIIFMFITNFSPSVVRACIMGILLLFSKICYRKSDIWTTIAISLLIMLIYNPYSIINVGLQLSYAGTIGIIAFNRIFTSLLEKYTNKKIALAVSVIISAQIVILPIMLMSFNSLSLNFILSNLLASPIVGIITIGGFILILVSFISIQIAKIFGSGIHIFLEILVLISEVSSSMPLSQIFVATPNIFQIIYYYFLIILFKFSMKNKTQSNLEKKILKLIKRKKVLLISIMLIISIISIIRIPKFTINFIDVGQRR